MFYIIYYQVDSLFMLV